MAVAVLMPALSPTMKEGTLAKWVKQEGDKVESGDVIAEIETDKATMEVEAVEEGVLVKIIVNEGSQNVQVNSLIAVIKEDEDEEADVQNVVDEHSATGISSNENSKDEPSTSKNSQADNTQQLANQSSVHANESIRKFATPLAKVIAKQNGVDINKITGSGPNGRVVKQDVENFQNSTSIHTTESLQQTFTDSSFGRVSPETTIAPVSTMRSVIAARLQESKQTIPHFYLTMEACIDEMKKMRSHINKASDVNENGTPKYKISVNDIIIKASAIALKKHPSVNASWQDNGSIEQYNNVDISVAVAIDNGLITPIIKNADLKSLSQLSSEMKTLASKAKQNQLRPEEFQGGGFTISNLGMYGVKSFQAIVNPPQAAILAVGGASKKLVLNEGKVSETEIIEFTISCDHRVIDGAVGAKFAFELKKLIENPWLMLV